MEEVTEMKRVVVLAVALLVTAIVILGAIYLYQRLYAAYKADPYGPYRVQPLEVADDLVYAVAAYEDGQRTFEGGDVYISEERIDQIRNELTIARSAVPEYSRGDRGAWITFYFKANGNEEYGIAAYVLEIARGMLYKEYENGVLYRYR
jgi:hypothetical protein